MEYTYKKLADVEALTEVPEGATVFAEVDGEVKRIPGSGLGGSDIKTAIIKSSDYDNALAGAMPGDASEASFTCINMTFEEAHQIMVSGELLNANVMFVSGGAPGICQAMVGFATHMFGVPCIMIDGYDGLLFWTADGLSTESPSSGGGPV